MRLKPAAFLVLLIAFNTCSCTKIRAALIKLVSSHESEVATASDKVSAEFTKEDKKRPILRVNLTLVAGGFAMPTDIQFLPGPQRVMVVSEKQGALKWINLRTRQSGTAANLKVISASEQGLLGLAFHPNFSKNQRLYLNYSTTRDGKEVSRVSEWQWPKSPFGKLISERIIMEVVQPYANHNAGQLAFGPDGYLYVGWGDGGWRDDKHGHGQNPKTLLGSMLRIDVNNRSPRRAYGIPKDNPFIKSSKHHPATWAFGLRNPWRYSFSPDGRLIVADVGQNLYEEVNLVGKGKNYGWNSREGFHCFEPKKNCRRNNLSDPILEYGRDEGVSITGGYVQSGSSPKVTKGLYIFGDFASGRIWAAQLPTSAQKKVNQKNFYSLGKWPLAISTFGRDASGRIYVADFGKGGVYQLN